MPGKKRGTRKAYHIGDYRSRVSVYEETNGVFYLRTSGKKPKSLGHRNFDRVRREAKDRYAKLELNLTSDGATVGDAIQLYLEHQSPKRTPAVQGEDRRRAEMWARVLGADKNLLDVTAKDWDDFTRDRLTGTINGRGEDVRPKDRDDCAVGKRAVGGDQKWLRGVVLWALNWKNPATKQFVLNENPLRGFAFTDEANPRRPVATQDRFEKVRAVSDHIDMEVYRGGKRFKVRSCLSEVLDIVNCTGRRISAIISLRYSDLVLKGGGPYGAIQWPADTDKEGKVWFVPMSAPLRAAIDRVLADRQVIGTAYLFPSPRKPSRHISKDRVRRWLLYAEELAGVEKQQGSLWHAYRRKWATERKHLPDTDVMQAGGWSNIESLKTAYQHADPKTMLQVMTEPIPLREAESA